jgi:hypothetical protein
LIKLDLPIRVEKSLDVENLVSHLSLEVIPEGVPQITSSSE